MQSIIDISWWQLGGFLLMLAIPAFINQRYQLRLGREASIATVRMVVQLILVGLYLQFLFSLNHLGLNLAWLMIMLLVGASAIIGKVHLPYRYVFPAVLAGQALGLLPLLAIILILLQPTPFYSAQYLIPLAGMLLGNSLSGNIMALQRLFNAFADRPLEYEGALALGATPGQAAHAFVQEALRQSLAPILASMATTGLVTLPGMMTGQILGGSDPLIAIKYQLMILVAIFVMLSISVVISLILTVYLGITTSGRLKIRPKP